MVAAGAGTVRLAAFLPCHPKDAKTLRLSVAALQEHPQVGDISVVADRSMEALCAQLGAGFIDELDVSRPWFADTEPYKHTRWYYQQTLKLGLAFTAARDLEHYLCVDADGVILRPFPFIDPVEGTVLMPRMSEHGERYFTGMRELLGLAPVYEGSHIAHFMVFRPSIVRAMIEACAVHAGRPPEEGLATLRDYLDRADGTVRAFAEYETYGYFARDRFPQELRWVERKQLNVQYVAPSREVVSRLRPWFDSCNFHAYRRPGNPFQRVAGRTWLEAVIARERLRALRAARA